MVAAREAGLADTYSTVDSGESLMLLRRIQRPDDTILVKGSRALALDRLADALVRPVTV